MHSRRFWYLYVCVTGAAVMMLEFAASRVMAPWFGTSIFVWGNVIGAVLIALSLGYYYGGRLADRHPQVSYLTAIVYGAGLFSAFIPVWLFLLTPQLSLVSALAGYGLLFTIIGSFAVIVLLFALPIGLLGMVSPFVIRLATVDTNSAGTVAGGLYAWSTIGSIVGTFASAFYFVPQLGSRETILLSAFSLLVIAVIGYPRRWWFIVGVAVPVGIYVLASTQPLRAATNSLAEVESRYQYIQVQDQSDRLALVFNEGLGTQSYFMKQGLLTGYYYDYLALLPQIVPTPQAQPKALVIGLAGGTLTRQLAEYYPTWDLTGVELDPAVVAVAQKYFALGQQSVHVVVNDGRMFLRAHDEQYDIIYIDAYTNEYYIPWHFTTQEFYQDVATHLTAGGFVAFNIGSASDHSRLFQSIVKTLQTIFPHVYVSSVPDTLNYVVVASKQELGTAALRTINNERQTTAQQLMRSWHEIPPMTTGTILTDNRAPIELYTESMIWKYLWDMIR